MMIALKSVRSVSFSRFRGLCREVVASVPVPASFPSLLLLRPCISSSNDIPGTSIDAYRRVYMFGCAHLLMFIGVVGRNLGSHARKPERAKRIGNSE